MLNFICFSEVLIDMEIFGIVGYLWFYLLGYLDIQIVMLLVEGVVFCVYLEIFQSNYYEVLDWLEDKIYVGYFL